MDFLTIPPVSFSASDGKITGDACSFHTRSPLTNPAQACLPFARPDFSNFSNLPFVLG